MVVDVTNGYHNLEEIEISRALFEIYEGAVVSFPRTVACSVTKSMFSTCTKASRS